jgi:hypothetical protein
MCRVSGILFSLVAAGDPCLGQSGANLVYAAESIVQRSKPASEAHPRTVTFTGDVLKARSFEKSIGDKSLLSPRSAGTGLDHFCRKQSQRRK